MLTSPHLSSSHLVAHNADAHTDPLFINLKILNLESIYKLQIGKFMYQCRSGLPPYSFNNMFSVTHQVHSCGARSSEFFHLPHCRTNIRKFSISFQGPNFLILLVLKFVM